MAAIDLTHRLIQNPPPPSPAKTNSLRWHPWRRLLQVLAGALLVGLPLTNGMRLDVRRHEFYFAWHKMAAHDLFLLFWVSMLGVWALVTVSVMYGRLWCGWVCPQTLASDFADSLKRRIDKAFRTRPGKPKFLLSRLIWSVLMLAMALGTGMTVASYWLSPHDVWIGTKSPALDIGAALTVYGLTALVAADLLWIRRQFCSAACPYGQMMGMVADKNTLAVRYLDERNDDCIKCGKCVVDCPMGIDIKQGAMQLACIGCGECVDACNDVLGKRGKLGLIEYRYGIEPERQTKTLKSSQRWGVWDGKRIGILVTLIVCVCVMFGIMFGRAPLSATLFANGAITRTASEVTNTYSVTIMNGTPDTQNYQISLVGLPQGTIVSPNNAISVGAHDERLIPVTLRIPAASAQSDSRTPITLSVRTGQEQIALQTIFYTPQH